MARGTIIAMGVIDILTVLGVILVSMMLHELMHGFVALRLGDETARLLGRLTFNPLKHIDPVMTVILPIMIVTANALTGSQAPIFGGAKPVPFNPSNVRHGEWGVALIALAGPFANLFIAFIAFCILGFSGAATGSMFRHVLEIVVQVNLGFFVFNILPIPPLDGSRAVYAIAPDFVRQAMELVERYGTVLVFAVVILMNSVILQFMSVSITFIIQLFSRITGIT